MERVDPRLRRIIDEGMRAAQPDARAEARVLARLIARLPPLGPGDHPDAPASGGVAPSATALGSISTIKLVVGGVIGAAAIAGVLATGLREPASANAARTPIAEDRVSQDAPGGAPTPASESVASLPAPPQAIPIATAPSVVGNGAAPRPAVVRTPAGAPIVSAADTIAAEAALLSAAEAALADGDDRGALALTTSHADRHPNGQLALEREAIAAAASCGLNDPDAPRRAAAFLAAHPRDAAAAKVRARCGEPEKSAPGQ